MVYYMVHYGCLRCGYIASQKINLKHHLHRKNICSPILEDISIEEVKFIYGFEITTKIHQSTPKLHQKPPKISTKNHQNLIISPPKHTKTHQKPPKSQVINECPYCYKAFSRIDSLNRHYGRCKIKKKRKIMINKKLKN